MIVHVVTHVSLTTTAKINTVFVLKMNIEYVFKINQCNKTTWGSWVSVQFMYFLTNVCAMIASVPLNKLIWRESL